MTHRFINADSIACGSGDSVQGYNLFAYCNNNPINQSDPDGHWPKWVKKAVKWIVKNVVKPVVKKVQKSFSKTNATHSRGINVSATPSAFSFNLQGGSSIDAKGNVALQCSYSGGVTGGNPSASITAYNSISNAPSVYKLEGTSYQLGGTLGVPVYGVPLAAGGDFNIIPDSELNKTYYGLTTNFGFGTPGGELHVEWGNTVTLISFNIFDEFDKAYSNIMRW